MKEVSATIVASDTVDSEHSNQLEIANTQLRKNRAEQVTVSCTLLRYKTKWSDKESGKHDRNHIDWQRSITKKKRGEGWNHIYVWDNIGVRFGLINKWDIVTSGLKRHDKEYAQDILQICVYFNHRFPMSKLHMLLGLAPKHHNMDIAMDLLLKSGLMTEYKNDCGENEYGIVEWISEHIQYKNEDGIKEEHKAMISAGKVATKARLLTINSGKNKRNNVTTNNSSAKKKKNVSNGPQHHNNDTSL